MKHQIQQVNYDSHLPWLPTPPGPGNRRENLIPSFGDSQWNYPFHLHHHRHCHTSQGTSHLLLPPILKDILNILVKYINK